MIEMSWLAMACLWLGDGVGSRMQREAALHAADPELEAPCTPPGISGQTCTTPAGGQYVLVRNLDYYEGAQHALCSTCPFTPDEDNTCLDLYLPRAQGAFTKPTLLYFHGGGFRLGGKANPADHCGTPANLDVVTRTLLSLVDLGYPVVNANYSLACPVEDPAGYTGPLPNVYPRFVQDAFAAMAWIRGEMSASIQGDDFCLPASVVAMGSSAGGLLVGLLGTAWNADADHFLPVGWTGTDPAVFRPDVAFPISMVSDSLHWGMHGWCVSPACSGFCSCKWAAACCATPPRPGYERGFGPIIPWPFEDLPPGVHDLEWAFGQDWIPQVLELPFLPPDCPPASPPCQTAWQGPIHGQHPNAFLDSAAVYRADCRDSPFVLLHSRCDFIASVNQTTRMAQALCAAGVSPVIVEIKEPGAWPSPCGHDIADIYAVNPQLGATELDGLIGAALAGRPSRAPGPRRP